jgi:hypothetical protein
MWEFPEKAGFSIRKPGFYAGFRSIVKYECMKTLLFGLALMLFGFIPRQYSRAIQSIWVVEPGSRLVIDGSSNINTFSCAVKKYVQCDTLRMISEGKTRKLRFQQCTIHIDVAQIDCQHRFITSDLRKTLKYPAFEYMKIHFVSLDDPFPMTSAQRIRGIVDIELAGHIKRIELWFNVSHQASGRLLHLTGQKALMFSDFELEPPKKMAGMIRINEELEVNVDLFFRRAG